MARAQSIDIRKQLTSLIPAKRLEKLARETGAVERERKIKIASLFWVLVLGFGAGKTRTFAGLRRMYESNTRTKVVPSSFWDRFTPELAKFLKLVCAEILDASAVPTRTLHGCLEGFRDLVIADGTVVRLHALLENAFAACRTNHTKAAAKLHAVMSVLGGGLQSVKITSERTGEREMLTIGPRVKDRLLLFDLGYYRFQLFDCIRRNGGFFISRLKVGANPLIVAVHRACRGRAVNLVGHRLQDVIDQLQRQVLDVEVEVRFQRRVYRGHCRWTTARFRLVGVLDQTTNEYHLYLTNIPPCCMNAQDVAAVYRARWLIELAFAELKGGYGLDQIPTSKKSGVEIFLYASIITMLASRRLLLAVRRKLAHAADRIPAGRWARIFRAFALDVLRILVAPARHVRYLAGSIETTMLHEALDPHLNRPGLLRQAENGIGYYAASAQQRRGLQPYVAGANR